ncbi:hypothetical protein JHU38_03270 [Prevotella sp. A2931]|uniref:Uncharacterized protein n=1 Tax=Prevotella illustrans TaxID=2800387 RepID=A0ABS3M3P7_9BACT|nr:MULTISPECIES: hypothetical protein [Prevotella]MBO1362808.1 hypothetical protein [Prevotella illustrans]PTL25874.1 hypothetical protein C3V39_01575 [Prevotella sp. oral taxon 820]
MNTALIGFILFVAVALVGWAIAELKNKTIHFKHSEAEAEGEKEMEEHFMQNGAHEQNLQDLLKHNCTKGYSAVD